MIQAELDELREQGIVPKEDPAFQERKQHNWM